MTTGTLYCPVCRWKEEEVSSLPEQCPQCGFVNVGVVVMQEDEREGPSEFVFSEEQKRQSWPKPFWRQLVRRIRDRELYMNPHEFARWFLQLVPGMRERRSPGRPRRGPFRDRDHCLQWLRQHAKVCLKNEWPITKERLGGLGGKSAYLRTEDPENAARTISRWCERYDIDFEADVQNFFE
jgi:hypothetical protein